MALSCSQNLSASIRRITSKHHSNSYCLNFLHSFASENKSEFYKNVYENKYFCNVIVPSEDTKILEFNLYQQSDKLPFVIYYLELECLIEKINGYKNNPENSYTTKMSKDIPSGFSVSTISSFKSIEKNLTDVKMSCNEDK